MLRECRRRCCPSREEESSASLSSSTTPFLIHHQWGHALNTLDLLHEALHNPNIDALEADVCWNTALETAVMKHASVSTDPTDLPVSTWLQHAVKNSSPPPAILKLDFKSMRAVLPVIHLLRAMSLNHHHTEVWLNADVLVGPGTLATPIAAHEFLDACDLLPTATLSLGWTTGWTPFAQVVYLDSHIEDMIALLNQRRGSDSRHVTFPIRASLARNSWKALSALLDRVPNSTITLWTGEEGVPASDLQLLDWADPHHQRFHVDCDKGPKHAKFHPMRLVHYLGLAVKHKRLW
jgi:hypothetical protein